MKIIPLLCLLFLTLAATAGETPYNDAADAKLEVKQALAEAVTDHTAVIVVFGANWCPDCQMLSTALKTGTSGKLLARDFKIVKVSVGNPVGEGQYDKNMDLAAAYNLSFKKGIPAVIILSTNNTVLYATRDGELAQAQKMGDSGIYDFFKRVTTTTTAKP